MKRKKIETFMPAKDDVLTMNRAKDTAKFISKHIAPGAKTVLDVGDNNPVGNYVAKELKLKIYNTFGDLDCAWNIDGVISRVDAVFCFETIEHLTAPSFFLRSLKGYIDQHTQIFITYPRRPKFLWTTQHFHEYDKKRFEYLVDLSGYNIIDLEKKRYKRKFIKYFNGLRTPLRIFFDNNVFIYMKVK